MKQSIAHVSLVVRDYDAVFADLYGNLWDLVEFTPREPPARRAAAD